MKTLIEGVISQPNGEGTEQCADKPRASTARPSGPT